MSFKPFPNTFVTDGTTQQFLTSITGSALPVGMAYLGQVSLSDMPDGITVQAEVEVYIYPQNVAYCIMRSAEVSPYQWECNSYEYRGWEAASGGEQIPQVFYWDGNVGNSTAMVNSIAVWTNIYNANQTHDVIICVPGPFSNRSATIYAYDSTTCSTAILKRGYLNSSDHIYFDGDARVDTVNNPTVNTYSRLSIQVFLVTLSFTSGAITRVTVTGARDMPTFLETDVNYSTPYTPLYAGSPATKKYVDDSISNSITTMLNSAY